MTLFKTRERGEVPRPGPNYVEDMYHRFHFPGFDQMMAEVVHDAKTNPEQFRDDMAQTLGLAPEEAANHVRDLLEQHFDRPGVAAVPPYPTTAER